MPELVTVAALFVEKNGPYFGLEGVDPWDVARDARKYQGPHPVVAHPPCSRWCRLAGLVEARGGHKKGDDEGCFAAALKSVREHGGVLEHPAYSDAWPAFDLPTPPTNGGWVRGICGGWSTHVEQGHYGHPARKPTWLYAFGASFLPLLHRGKSNATALVSWCNNRGQEARGERVRVGKKYASKTPEEFKNVLLQIARSVKVKPLRNS